MSDFCSLTFILFITRHLTDLERTSVKDCLFRVGTKSIGGSLSAINAQLWQHGILEPLQYQYCNGSMMATGTYRGGISCK